jgi:predicted GIY-YIG superfamily endonuclease
MTATTTTNNTNSIIAHYRYVLKLRESCYYVGTTSSWEERLAQHQTGVGGSYWTQRYSVIGVVEKTPYDTLQLARDHETRRTAELMLIHGTNKVRGGLLILQPPKWDYDTNDIPLLTRIIGHCLDINFPELERKLKQDLTIIPFVPPSPRLMITRSHQQQISTLSTEITSSPRHNSSKKQIKTDQQQFTVMLSQIPDEVMTELTRRSFEQLQMGMEAHGALLSCKNTISTVADYIKLVERVRKNIQYIMDILDEHVSL